MTADRPTTEPSTEAGFRDATVEIRMAPGAGWHDLREWVNSHPKFLFLRFIPSDERQEVTDAP